MIVSPLTKLNINNLWTRRKFVSTLANSTAGAAFVRATIPCVRAGARQASRSPKIAILATEVRKYSHAQHFIDRFLEGYGWGGRHHRSPIQLAALFVDQFPDGDLSRDRSRRHGLKIFPTISETLTLGRSKLAVDGVLIIAEHGKYPKNAKGQTLYPRYKFFKEVMQVFADSGRSVPVFNDKHLSTQWDQCLQMVQDSKRLGFPFLAGSSLPVTWRIPATEIPVETPLEESVCVCYGGVDSYDFHGLETAQCMSECRDRGEVGVRSAQALKGEPVWAVLAQREQTLKLVFTALARSHRLSAPPGFTFPVLNLDWLRQSSPEPIGYFFDHNDGFKTTMLLLNGLTQDFTYAGRTKDDQVISCQMHLPMPPQPATLANFFSPLVNNIERMILEGAAPYPVERTLLTSGMTLSGVESLHRGQALLSTPELNVAYRPSPGSTFWRE